MSRNVICRLRGLKEIFFCVCFAFLDVLSLFRCYFLSVRVDQLSCKLGHSKDSMLCYAILCY